MTVAGTWTVELARPARAPSRLADRILHIVLFVAVLSSSLVFIEPSPHDVLMGLLALACVIARVRFDRKLTPLLLMLMVWVTGSAASLLNVLDNRLAVEYVAISFYLAMAAVVFACLFSEDSVRRLDRMQTAYVLTALAAVALGVIGYFDLFAGAQEMFAKYGRARATFKDPNVFGPFLILPTLLLLADIITRGAKPLKVVAVSALMFGVLLSFSRGAWLHFAVSGVVLLVLVFATSPPGRARHRVVFTSIAAVAAIVALAGAVLSIDAINEMFLQRARSIQDYDVGPEGRFQLQKMALHLLLDFPNGMGPFGFQAAYGLQQHNVYLQAFLVYGWIGGTVYVTLLLLTLAVGLRAVFVPTPWQPYLVCAIAAMCGEIVEGFVVDTDHWRHFFLILGMIWGLTVATLNQVRRAQIHEPARPVHAG